MAAEIKILVEGYVRNDGESVGSTVSLIKSKSVNLVVDPGLVKERAEITHGLLKKGLRVEDITHVFITHHHPDHTVNVGMFPNAKVIDVDSIYYKDTWLEHERNYRITDEIAVIPTPGHTMEDATLLVRTEEGVVDLQKNQFVSWGQILRSGRAGTSHRGLNDRVRAVVRAMVEEYGL